MTFARSWKTAIHIKEDVVIVKAQDKNRGKWPLGIVVNMIPGKDGVVKDVRLRAGKKHL